MKMKRYRHVKSIYGLLLVIALVCSIVPAMPSSVAYAAATNLLPASLTLGGNIKVSSQNSTRTGLHIGDAITWTQGSNTVYSPTGSNLWAAIDLGSASKIEGLIFNTSTDDVNAKIRSSQYEVSYSNDASLWSSLSSTPSNSAITFSPTAAGWTSAAIVPMAAESGTVSNATYSWSLVDGKYTTNLTFSEPITARYLLVNYTLKPSVTGQLGIGLLQILPPVTLSSSSGTFYKTLQNPLSTQISLDANTSFTDITNGLYTLVQGTDYTIDADNVVTFSTTYLNGLSGNQQLSFHFSSSQGGSSLPYALTVVEAADSSLSPQGAIYIGTSPSVISTTMNLNSNSFESISEGGATLSASNYTVSGTTVTFNPTFLNTLSKGAHAFTFTFNQGNPQTFMLTVSGNPPAANIDYRYWTLQEPLPGGAGQTSQALQGGYADPYFYIGADGSQVFMDTAVGGTTSGSAHPRSELREYDPVAGENALWLPTGTNVMTNTVAVTKLGTLNGVGWTTIGQVFDNDTTTLLELEYGYDPARPNGNIRILYEPSGINSIGYQYLPIQIPLNQYFTYRLALNDGVLSVYLNGELIFNGQTASPNQVVPPTHRYYFKAGNYDQTATNGPVNYIPYTVVQFKAIDVYHGPTASDNADLSSLALSSGTLSPAFAADIGSYSSSVPYAISSVTVKPSADDSHATITVNGKPAASGQTGSAINLNVGNNVISIVVTAENGETKTYTVTVTRASDSEGGGNGGGYTPPSSSDTKLTSTDGKLKLSAGKAGEVSLGAEMTVAIPADASGKELTVTIEKISDTLKQQLITGQKEALVSSIYELLKNISENFSKPVTLNFTFDPSIVKADQKASVFYYDEPKKVWVEVPGGKVSGNRISVEVDHFTKYAVFAADQKPATNEEQAVRFSDIAGHWAESKLKQAVVNGIVSGYPDGTFKPNHTVTRAEFAVMLMNGLKPQGDGDTLTELTFTDSVNIPSWAQKAIAQAAQAQIISGYDDGSFRPDAEITRAEMAVMIAIALKLKVEVNAATGFADDQAVPAWAKGAVVALAKQKLVEGQEANEFAPVAPTTRAEAVTVILNALAMKSK
ncbi:S-layer homology domain-containing protein [Paenibacillus ferrarius]|uniref:S-layer homology domain-containing protein n=1 Tax=Paenibacillus ferrarius TaxID=1469647 RepID=UPI003D2DBE83